jgi:uncharacterized membrane protein (DUF2068 family)
MVDWSLLACGRSGHVTYAPDEPDVRRQLSAQAEAGPAWRCLRCGTFVTGAPQLSGPAAQAPAVRRGKEIRSALILRVFAIERFIRALAAGALAVVVWRLSGSRESLADAFEREIPIVRSVFHQVGYNIDKSKFVGLIHRALTLSPAALKLVGGLLALYAVIEVIEGAGLWLARRWGEYFAMVATSLGLPYEVYELTLKVTVTKSLLFAVNLALVLYLVITKRLFGVRGGSRAYEARLRSESVMDAALQAAAAEPAAAGPDSHAHAGSAAAGPDSHAHAGAEITAARAAASTPGSAAAAP